MTESEFLRMPGWPLGESSTIYMDGTGVYYLRRHKKPGIVDQFVITKSQADNLNEVVNEAMAESAPEITKADVERVLRENGLTDQPEKYDSDIHGWRCKHPDRYGKCDCFSQFADSILALLKGEKSD